MAFGFPASYQVEHQLTGNRQNARSAIINAFDVLRWSFEMQDKDTFRVSLAANVLSWGETVVVSLEPGVLRVKSICKLPTQVFDWGRNKQNVKQFLAYFETNEIGNQQLASEHPFPDDTWNTPLERALIENDD